MPATRKATSATAAKKAAPEKPVGKAAKPAAKEVKTATKEAKTASKPAAKDSRPAKATPAPAAKATTEKRARSDEADREVAKPAKKAAAPAAAKSSKAAAPAKAVASAVKNKKPTKADAIAELNDDEIKLNAEDDSDSEAEDDEDDAAILAGFSDVSDEGADSSDDDDDDDLRKNAQISASGVVKLPSSRDDAVVRQRLDKANKKRKESGVRGTPIVLYFGRVPKSMPESALRAYLTQFGDVRRLRLSRNRVSGASKHYAFVEFDDEEVGKIVQETMHNYLLEGRLLQVHVVPKERQHPSLWVGANRTFRKAPADRLFRVKHDMPRTDEQKRQAEDKLLQRQEKRRKRIQNQGIDYEFAGYAK